MRLCRIGAVKPARMQPHAHVTLRHMRESEVLHNRRFKHQFAGFKAFEAQPAHIKAC